MRRVAALRMGFEVGESRLDFRNDVAVVVGVRLRKELLVVAYCGLPIVRILSQQAQIHIRLGEVWVALNGLLEMRPGLGRPVALALENTEQIVRPGVPIVLCQSGAQRPFRFLWTA